MHYSMKKTKRLYKKRRTRRNRKMRGGDMDARTGLPLLASDAMDYISSSMTSMKNTILGNY